MRATYQGRRFDPKGFTLPMARIVMKFGGTSMAGIERIRNVAARVKREVDAGNEVAVVVSAMAGEGFDVPTDAFVEILLRLPTSARRRFRLVCKRWRDVIDERTPERQVRTKTLAFIGQRRSSRALVFDNKDGRRRHE